MGCVEVCARVLLRITNKESNRTVVFVSEELEPRQRRVVKEMEESEG
jgi:hypothetical protein